MSGPIVTWATPQQRAMRALNDVGELMEAKKISQARAQLRETIVQLHELMRQIDREELEALVIARRQAEARQ